MHNLQFGNRRWSRKREKDSKEEGTLASGEERRDISVVADSIRLAGLSESMRTRAHVCPPTYLSTCILVCLPATKPPLQLFSACPFLLACLAACLFSLPVCLDPLNSQEVGWQVGTAFLRKRSTRERIIVAGSSR